MIVLVMSKLMEEISEWQRIIEDYDYRQYREHGFNTDLIKTLNLCIHRNIDALHKLSTIIPRGHVIEAEDKARLKELMKTAERIWDEHPEIRNLLSSYNLVKVEENINNGNV